MNSVELPSGMKLVEEEKTENHWLGTCGEVVLLFLYEGSASDVRHVQVSSRAVQTLAKKLGRPCKFLVVLRSKRGKPPDAPIRSAVADAIAQFQKHTARAAVAVVGSGFASSIHRGVIAGVYALVGPSVPFSVHATIPESLAALMDAKSPDFQPLVQACEALVGPQ